MDETEIKDGIEWWPSDYGHECSCGRCGSTADFLNCWNCGGDGWVEPDDWQDFDEPQPCMPCKSVGGSWHCTASPEWCEANPLPGREHITSTALCAEAWND